MNEFIDIKEDDDIYLPQNFLETVENDKNLLYTDTDSAYLLYELPFDKFEDIFQLVDYIQGIAEELRSIYNVALNHYGQFANLNPEYNTMDFKSEVIAYRGFFLGKKINSMIKAWDEGEFFEEKPKLKITGGAIKKSDTSTFSKKMLDDIYEVLVQDINNTNLVSIYKKIFIEIKEKYKTKILQDISNFDLKEFGKPAKWGSTKKMIPPHVWGALLYNAIISDTFRPSDSFIILKVKIEIPSLIEYFEENNMSDDEYSLQLAHVKKLKNKLNVICIPSDLKDEEIEELKIKLATLHIKVDVDEIIDNNITKKIEAFEKLFPLDVKMDVSV